MMSKWTGVKIKASLEGEETHTEEVWLAHRDVIEMGFMPKSTTYYVCVLGQKIQLWEDGSNIIIGHT